MRTFLKERVYFSPNDLAEQIAEGAFDFPRDVHHNETEEIAARLACWVAGEAEEFVDIDDKDDWPLIAMMAELAALTMLLQRDELLFGRGARGRRRSGGIPGNSKKGT